MKDKDSRLLTEAYNKLLLEMDRTAAVHALVQAAGQGRDDLHDIAADIRSSMTRGEYVAVLNTINRTVPKDERTPGLNSIISSGLPPPEKEPTREYGMSDPEEVETDIEYEDPEEVEYNDNPASFVGPSASRDRPPTDFSLVPKDWMEVFSRLGFEEIEHPDEQGPGLMLAVSREYTDEAITILPDRKEFRLNISQTEYGGAPTEELGLNGKVIDLPGGPNSEYWRLIIAAYVIDWYISLNYDPGPEMMETLENLTGS